MDIPSTSDYLKGVEQPIMADEADVLRLAAAVDRYYAAGVDLDDLSENELSWLLQPVSAVAKKSRYEPDWEAAIQHKFDERAAAIRAEINRRREAYRHRPIICCECNEERPASECIEIGEIAICRHCSPQAAAMLDRTK